VGYVRLAAIPVFLALALDSGDGRYAPATLLFIAIAAGDYVDGFLARATGQYSRMGALLDPVVDRATVLSGVVVCWHFELLPRWALAALAARELITLVLAQVSLRRGIEIEINWIGRIGVFGIFGTIGLSLMLAWGVIEAVFVLSVAISIAATTVYIRVGLGRS
jgi:cardiolipin synthase